MRIDFRILLPVLLMLIASCEHAAVGTRQNTRAEELISYPETDNPDSLVSASAPESVDVACDFEKYSESPHTSQLAKDIFADRKWDLSNDTEALALLDSLNAKDAASRPFYFKVVTKSKKKSDGYYSEGLGLMGKEYVENHTEEFLSYFEDASCFTSGDLETWADIVLLEFSLGIDNENATRFVSDYCGILRRNCRSCTPSQMQTLERFSVILQRKWVERLSRNKAENSEINR